MRNLLSIGLASAALVLATATAHAEVSVDEIVRLHTAGLSDQSLLLVISASDTPDTLTTAQLTQMIEAHVPDTVISAIVAKADAVMEDWHPVNVDSVMNGREIHTETEVYNVYPSWSGYWSWPGYGWCGTPYYGGWYGPGWGNYCGYPYSGLYVGVGWCGNWSVGIGFGGGYCGYYDPWYYGGYCGGWGSGYCGNWADPYPGGGYNNGSTYRVIDRPNYHNGASRGASSGGTATPYTQDPLGGTNSSLSQADGRRLTTVDGSRRAADGGRLRGGSTPPTTTPTTRSADNLDQLSTPPTDKGTLAQADKGDGRYLIKGDDKQLRNTEDSPGRTMETLGEKWQHSEALGTGSTKSGRSVQDNVSRGLENHSAENNATMDDRLSGATRGAVTNRATPGLESTTQKVNRYIEMKNAQRATGVNRGNRGSVATRRLGTAGGEWVAPSGGRGDKSTSSVGQAPRDVNSGRSTGKAPATSNRGAARQVGGGAGGTRSTPSAGAPARQGGGGGMRAGGAAGGGGGARGGGGGARGGGGGGRGGGRGGR